MPILYNPRSRRLFESAPCPADCIIPTGDPDAYGLYPEFRWVCNKLAIAELQGIKCGPHKTRPGDDLFPIFSKPIYNLGGMGAEARVIKTQDDYWRSVTAGHMWSALLTGEHYSTDIAVVSGKPVWFSHTRGFPGPDQTWDYWEINIQIGGGLEEYITGFIEKHLSGYTGMLNMETIGGKIIEVHLRLSPQWADVYGSWFLTSLVDLYCGEGWTGPSFTESKMQTGYSVVLFDDVEYAKVGTALTLDYLRQMEAAFGVSSITIGYNAAMPLETYFYPPGGFRIAWINGFDLDKCKLARRTLQMHLHKLYRSQFTSARTVAL
ncbi:hypothetical protein MW887_003204 [Aspergillus wentii]|nr:hypothetical protein MW887_003204 [Aspergillus wentii]